jgi:hypothetical protein
VVFLTPSWTWMGIPNESKPQGWPRNRPALSVQLEVVAESDLQDAGIGCGGCVAVGAGAEGCGDSGEVGVVEDVEGLATELEEVTFGYVEILVEGHVEVDEARTLDAAGGGVAVVAGFGRDEGRGVEPFSTGLGTFDRGPGDTIGTESVALVRDAEEGGLRGSTAQGGDVREFPPA